MNIRETLNEAMQRLAATGIEDARLEAAVLLQAALGWSKAELLARLTDTIPEAAARTFAAYLERRLAREPSAYITGHREFYGLDLEVSPAVLIPRPETELVVEAALTLARERHPEGAGVSIADIGTGSGAIALALAGQLSKAEIYALDISADALAVAQRNAERLDLRHRICFLLGDLVSPLPGAVDIIAANLPYVGTHEGRTLAPEISEYEPHVALFAGPTGLALIERLLMLAPGRLRPQGAIVLEIDEEQGGAVSALIERYLPHASRSIGQDLAGMDRVAVVRT